jgi:ABC-type uncharacterized transport system ATPase subunit
MTPGLSDSQPRLLELVDAEILLLSEGLDELVALSDRKVVMAGKIIYSAPINEIDRQLVGEKMASH